MTVLLHLRFDRRELKGMRNHGPGRNPLFRKRWFADEVIITCVRWYLSCMALRATKADENACTSVHLANIQ